MYTETLLTVRGESITLKAVSAWTFTHRVPEVHVWGRIGQGRNLFLPNDPDRSVDKHGGVEGYKNSPARELLHHITPGQFLAFSVRAIQHFHP
jgi:hypothetical protein